MSREPLKQIFQPALSPAASPIRAPELEMGRYSYARALASQNMALRLIYSAMQEGVLPPDTTLEVADEKQTDFLHNAHELYDYLYTREHLTPANLTLRTNGQEARIEDISAFLNEDLRPLIIEKVPEASQNANWLKFQYEILDSLNHETLAILEKLTFQKELEAEKGKHEHFWDWVVSGDAESWLSNHNHDLDSFLLQLSAFSGHPTHPSSKMRQQLDPKNPGRRSTLEADDAKRFFPEFAPDVDLALYAVRKDRLTATAGKEFDDFRAFIGQAFPDAIHKWEKAVEERAGPDQAKNYLPIPVHPLQVDEIAHRFSDAVENKEVIPLPEVSVSQRPTLSTRTLTPVNEESEPQIKTTINMQMTSVVRTIAPARAYNSPVYSDLVKEVVDSDESLAPYLRPLKEQAAIYFGTDANPDSKDYKDGYHLSAVFKQNPAQLTDAKEEVRMPVAALLRETPFSNQPVLCDIMRAGGVDTPDAAKKFFKDYADTVVKGEVGILARYGIGLEGHQQNDDVVFDASTGRPKATIYRDINGGIEASEPLLSLNGHEIGDDLHPLKKGMCDSIDLPLQQTMHTTFHCHLFPVVALIAKEYDIPKTELYGLLRNSVEETLESAKEDHLPKMLEKLPSEKREEAKSTYMQEWQKISEGLLSRELETKCLLGMRLAQTQEMGFTKTANPLAR